MACAATMACSVGTPRPAAALRCQRATRVQRAAARLVTRAAAGDVLLEVHDLQAKIAATGQQILKGVTLTGECASLAAPRSHAVAPDCAARRAGVACGGAAGGRVAAAAAAAPRCNGPPDATHCLQCARARCTPSWARTAPARARSPRCAGWRAAWGRWDAVSCGAPPEQPPNPWQGSQQDVCIVHPLGQLVGGGVTLQENRRLPAVLSLGCAAASGIPGSGGRCCCSRPLPAAPCCPLPSTRWRGNSTSLTCRQPRV